MESAAIGQDHWQRVKKRLRAELGEDVFTSWFTRVDLEESANGTINLSVPTRFLKQWIQSHYRDRLIGLWRNECENIQRIELTVRGAVRARVVKPNEAARMPSAQRSSANQIAPRTGTANGGASDRLQSLDARLTFANFAKGRSNNLALAAARQVATSRQGDPVSFNPLYIHAAVGLGKTHLLQAVAWEAGQGENPRRVLYLTAEGFMYGFVNALKTKSALDFKDRLRGIDLLLIDDLQFLYGQQIQQEFCHTLNALIDNGRQVAVAADRPPVELEALDERVRSRLTGGLAVEIGSPDHDLRRDILNRRIADVRTTYPDFSVPQPVIDYIARSIVSNGRDLDGAVNRLVAHNQLTGSVLSIEMAEVTLRDLIRAREPRRVRIEDIQRIVSKHYNVSKADLLSARRTRTIVRPRQVAMYLSKMMTPRSLPEIGRRFGGRDHTTVLHAVRKIESLVSSDHLLAEEIELLKRLLDG